MIPATCATATPRAARRPAVRGAWRVGPWPELLVAILLLMAGVACVRVMSIDGALGTQYMPSSWYGSDDANVNAWMQATATGDVRRLARMLDERACDVDAQDDSGRTALILAAQYGRDDCCRLLVSHGARLDVTSSCGFAPLAGAAAFGHESAALLLLAAGADVNQRAVNGQTPLMLAAANGETKLLRAMLDAGAAINATDDDRADALHHAARCDADVTAIAELVEAGLDVNAVDRFGQTPLMVAAESDNPEGVRVLLSLGADPHRKDRSGRDAMAHAEGASPESTITRLLLGGGAAHDASPGRAASRAAGSITAPCSPSTHLR